MLTHPQYASERQRLKKRAAYFFATRIRARYEVADFAATLSRLGRVVVIGGFLRDLCLAGNREFKSDVDFVIDPASTAEFDQLATRLGARTNRFGGYEIKLGRWKVDVWPLERTWAVVQGHVSVSCLHDLVKVTFFDWDAVLYAIGEQEVIASEFYFDRMQRRVIDINLEPNPNPFGNAVRALRYACRWDAAFGERLAVHVAKQIRDHGWERLVASERRSFGTAVLGSLDGDMVKAALRDQTLGRSKSVRLCLRPMQQELPLDPLPAGST